MFTGGVSLPLSVPGGLFTAPLGSSMPSNIGYLPHGVLFGGSPRSSSGHVELFQRSSFPSGGSLPLSLPRSGDPCYFTPYKVLQGASVLAQEWQQEA